MRDVLCLILGGGRGSRLYPLTKLRSKPAVPIGGKYRLIDVPISNCINSGLNRIYVLTQYMSVSLHNHIGNVYKFDQFNPGFVEILAAQQTEEAADWYQGTADAVRQNLQYISRGQFREVLILSGDQLYRMNFMRLIERHRSTQADVTIAVLPVARDQVGGFGLVRIDQHGRVVGFVEKPQTDAEAAPFVTPPGYMEKHVAAAHGREFLASMGIYVFNTEPLIRLLHARPPATDFGKDVFPRSVRELRVQTHVFDGYWEDIGTVRSYHECHLALAGDNAPFQFHHPDGVIYTRMRNLPPSKVVGAMLANAIVSDGCVIAEGARVERSVIGVRSRIGKNAVITESVLIGADRYETDAERVDNERRRVPHLTVGDDVIIERAILDKDCRIGDGARIVNANKRQEAEAPNYSIRDGIVVIPRGAVIKPGEVI